MAKVFVGISGGVDSAVSARLLLDAGHEVIGVFIKIWQPEFLECTWEEDRLSAKRVAAALGIPFLEVDLSAEYQQRVVEDMIRSYERGETPNPDVLCNEYIKFGAFLEWAMKNGAEKIATGHYARIVANEASQTYFKLYRGIDSTKDQSYFLHRIAGGALSHVLFPIGGYTKKEIRAKAQSFDLPNAKRKDSQGLCFVGDIDIGEFLSRFVETRPGDVLDAAGLVIGKHQGYMRYTTGERRGFTITGEKSGAPHYVIAIDPKQNTITVSTDAKNAHRARIHIADVHWINEPPLEGRPYDVEVRYHQKPQRARLEGDVVVFEAPQLVAPGQSVVFYDADRCLGGGIACV